MDGGFEVHRYAACSIGRSWVPSWKKNRGKKKACPAWYHALLRQVLKSEVVCRGELKDTGFVSEATLDRMKALGVI